MNTLISTSIASDICLYLFQMIVEDDSNNKKEVCERILEETMGIYRDGSTSSSSSSSSLGSIPVVSLQDLRVFVDLSLVLAVANKTQILHAWVTKHIKYYLHCIVDSPAFAIATQHDIGLSLSPSIEAIMYNMRKIIGLDTIYNCIRDMIHSSDASMFDPDMRFKYIKQCPLHNSTILLLLMESVNNVDRLQALATSALRISLQEKNHTIVMRAVNFADWVLQAQDFEN